MPNYLPSLAERKARLFEDVCATCGGEGEASDGGGNAMDEVEGQDQDTTLLKTLRMLKDKKKNKKTKTEAVLPLMYDRDKKDAEEFAKRDARMKYGKAGKPTSLARGEVLKPKRGGGFTSNKRK